MHIHHASSYRLTPSRAASQSTIAGAILLLRLALGSLLLSLAFLTMVGLAVPPFGAALAAQGMPLLSAWPAALTELVAGLLLILGSPAGTPDQ
jgi:uncharacterized membrane protein YphA (DoxX/SURF4 family)